MPTESRSRSVLLQSLYPPSEPCSCEVCLRYCMRPGWWTLHEAKRVLRTDYVHRIMLEISPERTFGVLSPAFRGCEGNFALQESSRNGCTFFVNNLCELYGTGLQPLECRFCHHDRVGQGIACHTRIEQEWDHPEGWALVDRWIKLVNFRHADYYRKISRNRNKG